MSGKSSNTSRSLTAKRGKEQKRVPETATRPEKTSCDGPARSPSLEYVSSFEGDSWTPTSKRLRLRNGRFATSEQSVFEYCEGIQSRLH